MFSRQFSIDNAIEEAMRSGAPLRDMDEALRARNIEHLTTKELEYIHYIINKKTKRFFDF